jgi:MoaD family protein
LKVKVRYFTILRELTGFMEETFELKNDICLEDLIETIASKYGEKASQYLYVDEKHKTINPIIRFLINGRDANTFQGLKTKLKDGDIVAIVPPVGGG